MPSIKVIIPAFNEEKSIAKVIAEIPDLVEEIVVVNNNSTDQTEPVARKAGATVLTEKNKGYGYACLKGINYLSQKDKTPDILVFLDGDFSDFPHELTKVIQPIIEDRADFVVGARVKRLREIGSLTPQQVFGNWLACFLMKILYKSNFTDLGPFRAIRWSTLEKLEMSDKTYGWTVEMQLKILRHKIAYQEIPVSYKKRIGVSKVSGTVKGTIFAGVKIIGWIFKHYLQKKINMEHFWLNASFIVMGLYAISLLLVFFYSLAQLNLLFNYKRAQKNKPQLTPLDTSNIKAVPYVTIQLPVFNELYVMERLLKCINEIEYPRERLEIQVLDDSTDESVELTRDIIADLQKGGLDIVQIRRKDRVGFKAGALKEGLKSAKGELIAIFDADFLPRKDWLLKTVPQFDQADIGVVQTKWEHINHDYSILTEVQAFALDAHFTLEQVGRNSEGHFINFNGTAGIWRKETIIDAGNWEGDTLTEDLDLSYRAQLKNWKFKYLEEVETPSELPVVMSAIRSQQFRWNKGGAENYQKMIKKVINNKEIPFGTKVHSILHLLNSTMFLNVLIVGILSIPMLYIKNEWGHLAWFFKVSSLFIVSTVIFFYCYWELYRKKKGSGLLQFLEYTKTFFTFYTVAMGFSFHNALAVLEGHRGKRSDFIRTPKFNIQELKDSWKNNKYIPKKVHKNTIVEGLLSLYFLFGMYSAFTVGEAGDFGLFPFHLLLFVGFGFIFINSFRTQG